MYQTVVGRFKPILLEHNVVSLRCYRSFTRSSVSENESESNTQLDMTLSQLLGLTGKAGRLSLGNVQQAD